MVFSFYQVVNLKNLTFGSGFFGNIYNAHTHTHKYRVFRRTNFETTSHMLTRISRQKGELHEQADSNEGGKSYFPRSFPAPVYERTAANDIAHHAGRLGPTCRPRVV